MHIVTYLVCILSVLLGLFAALYYISFAIVGIFPRKNHNKSKGKVINHFAILIPAYNEAKTITETITSCKQIDYSEDDYSIFIIADNCTDDTASVVSREGAICLERFEPGKRGKGHALTWGFQRVLEWDRPFDAIVVLDADCKISRNALCVFNEALNNGEEILQANDLSSNPDDTALSYVLSVGNWIENNLFYFPKSILGLPVFLRGTGMVFKKDVLVQYPWDAVSIAEDKEYAINLLSKGKKVVFLKDVEVTSIFPTDKKQFEIQRTRWAKGNLRLSKVHAIKYIQKGITQKDITLTDIGVTLLLDSKPLVLLEFFFTLAFCIFAVIQYPGMFSYILLYCAVFVGLLQFCYLAIGILTMGLDFKRLFLLLQTPWYFIKLIFVSIRGLLSSDSLPWSKTPRNIE